MSSPPLAALPSLPPDFGGFDLAQLTAAIAEMAVAVLIVAPGRIVGANRVAMELFGEEKEEQVLISYARIVASYEAFQLDGSPLPATEWPGVRALRGERVPSLALRVRRVDTGKSWIANYTAAPVRDAQGRVCLALVTIEEISERLRVEEALRQSEERYRSLVAASAAVVWTTDAQGSFQMPQESWAAYTGQSWEQHRDWGWLKMIHAEDRDPLAAHWRASLDTRTSYASHGRLWHAAGQEYRYFEVRAVPILRADGTVREWMGTCVDTHERQLAEERERYALREAEAASRAKDEFLAVLSHELRTPLMPALLTVADLTERPELSPAVRSELAVVRRNIELEAKLIDDLLDHTRIRSGKLAIQREVVDVEAVLRETMRDAESDYRRKDLLVRLEPTAGEVHLSGDAVRLRQIFWNLLRNAIKFTPIAGGIICTTGNPRPGRIAISLRDSGIGIEPEMLPRIFSRFEQGGVEMTRRYGGLGLGLAITKSLVELHGGSITVSSPGAGKGAIFTLEFPTVPDPRARLRKEIAALRPAPLPRRILLVEDHDDTRNVMATLLRRSGHTVVPAASVAEALAAAAAGQFDLLISDLGLPDGDGRDLLRQLPPGWRAISLSGFGMEQDVAASRAAGFAAHLTKPIEFSRLRALVQEVTSA